MAGLFLAVLLRMSLHCLFSMPPGMDHVASSGVSMVRRLFVKAGLVMFRRFPVVPGSMCKMFRCLLVVFRSFLRHMISPKVVSNFTATRYDAPLKINTEFCWV
jgi:hypothetical protein